MTASHANVLFGPGTWREEAACAGMDPDIFFPADSRDSLAAQVVCVHCPVIAECLEVAIRNHECFGVWGGTTEAQRRAIRLGAA